MDREQIAECLRSLIFQQIYVPVDVIINRTRGSALSIAGSGRIFETLLGRVVPLSASWGRDRQKYGELLTDRLHVDHDNIKKAISNKLGIDAYDPSTWEDVGLTEDQVCLFLSGQTFAAFYQKTVDLAFHKLRRRGMDVVETRALLSHEFSLLGNLLYMGQLARHLNMRCPSNSKAIERLLPHFLARDREEYLNEIKRHNSDYPLPDGALLTRHDEMPQL